MAIYLTAPWQHTVDLNGTGVGMGMLAAKTAPLEALSSVLKVPLHQ